MKTEKASVDSTGRKMVRLTSTMLAYNTRPLSVPVATLSAVKAGSVFLGESVQVL